MMQRLPQWFNPFHRSQPGFSPTYDSYPSSGPTTGGTEGEFIPPSDFLENLENTMATADRVIPNLCHRFRPYRYYSSREKWKHLQMPVDDDAIHDMIDNPSKRYPNYLRILSWNIDFTTPYPGERIVAGLRHIQSILGCKTEEDMPEDPCVILLQEIQKDCFHEILDDEWVRRCFIVAPASPDLWPDNAWYGNVTLVSKRLAVVKCQILHYAKTAMERAALAVYVLLSEPEPSEDVAMICVVNTHLESLREGFTYRPEQLKLCAGFLKQEDVRGGVVVGDMNSIMAEDANLHVDVQLRDAWRRGNEDEEGFTWGYQEVRDPGKYPPARLDKVLYLPRRGYKVDPPQRFGIDERTASGHWVSDHYGIKTTLRLIARRNSGGTS